MAKEKKSTEVERKVCYNSETGEFYLSQVFEIAKPPPKKPKKPKKPAGE